MELEELKNQLLQKGKETGFLSVKDINALGIDSESDDYDEIENFLQANEIDIISDDSTEEFSFDENNLETLDDDLFLDDDTDLDMFQDEDLIAIEEFNVESDADLNAKLKVDDPVRMYLKEIGTVKLLGPEEETQLAIDVSNGKFAQEQLDSYENGTLTLSDNDVAELKKLVDKSEYAKNKLVESNLRLVVNQAKRYMGRGMQFLDLIQEGNMGLIKAVDKFDYEKGYKFSTYATWWIKQAISRAVADQARTIRIPVHMVETINKLVRVQRQLVQEKSREPYPEEVAEKMGISVEKVQMIQKIAQDPISLEQPIGEEEDSSLGDFISDPNSLNPYEYTSKEMLKKELNEVLSGLTDREEKVLRMRFGLLDGRCRTLEEVGKEFGVTRERIRQIEAKALRKLKHPTRSKKLKDFIGKK